MHRDIKLENILLDGHGNAKIVDFGVSVRIKYFNQAVRGRCGTSVFMAPEIANSQEYEGPPVDIWSAGICLFALLQGQVPFESALEEKVDYTLHFEKDVKLSQAGEDILTKML